MAGKTTARVSAPTRSQNVAPRVVEADRAKERDRPSREEVFLLVVRPTPNDLSQSAISFRVAVKAEQRNALPSALAGRRPL